MIDFCGLKLKNNIFLAPMAGYTDASFRKLCIDCGAGLTFGEMVSAKGLYYDSKNTQSLLKTTELEKISAVQLFGSECSVFVKILQGNALQKFDIIDINMGCPAKKIVKNCEGSALMSNPLKAAELITACRKSTDKVLSVKFRLGKNENSKNCVEFAKMCADCGADFVTIHGRYIDQGFSGLADRESIAEVVSAVKIPVVANGDIDSLQSLEDMKKTTNAAAFMVGRATIGNPFLFCELTGTLPTKTLQQTICEHLDLMQNMFGEYYATTNIKKHINHYLKGMSRQSKLKFFELKSVEEMKEYILQL